jgi:predicted ATPase
MTWEAKYIGRNSELKLLMFGLEQARNNNGSILFITGEAGIGKTRLVEELPDQETTFEFELLSGQCMYREGTDPYLPFIEMFKAYLSSHPYMASSIQSSLNSQPSVILDIFPTEKGRYSPAKGALDDKNHIESDSSEATSTEEITNEPVQDKETPSLAGTDNDTEVITKQPEIHEAQLLEGKHRMFETISKIIIDISKKKPLVLFLDDMQWADVASLHLLHYLARNIQNQPILIIGAYRPEDLDYTRGRVHPLQELITRLGTENLYSTLELKRLNLVDTVQIVSDLLGVENIPEEFGDLIYNETEGNPFFIKEVLRSLVEDGALSIKQDKLVLNISSEEMVIPTSIKELIKLRLQRLEDDELEVLEYASVIGNEFDLEVLENIIDIQESKLINILSKLTEARFIQDPKEDKKFTWNFSHNKVLEVIYNEINENKKKLIHLRLAKYLEDWKIDNIDEVVYDLAYHFYHGFDFDRALSYSIEGGEKALKSYANKEALDLYNISLNSLRRLDEDLASTKHYQEKKIEVLSKLGILNKTLGEWDKALEYYEQILPISDDINAPHIKSRTFMNIGWIYQQRSYWNEAQNYFQKSLSMANVIQDFNISAEAYNGLGAVCERKGKFEDALEYYSTSRKFAEENYDLLNLAKAHNAFGRIYNQQRNYSKAVEHKQTSIALFERIKDLPEMAKGYTSLALTFYDMGNMEKNIEFNEKCIELADEIADIRIKGYGLSNAVESLVKTQQLDKALDYFKKLEERFMISLNYMNFGVIFKNKNEWNKSKYYFKTAIEFMENLKIPYHLADCYQQFADMYKRKGESAKATYYLEKAREIYISLSADSYIKHIDDELKSFGNNSIC